MHNLERLPSTGDERYGPAGVAGPSPIPFTTWELHCGSSMNEKDWLILLLLSPRHPALSNLPGVHRQAIEATMNEVSQICLPASSYNTQLLFHTS